MPTKIISYSSNSLQDEVKRRKRVDELMLASIDAITLLKIIMYL